jgi:methylated-DNA-[protein]-cysteine S-methyltransferase
MANQSINTPVGIISVFEQDGTIIAVEWGRVPDGAENDLTREAIKQLRAYFDGDLTNFDLPLDPPGSQFQKDVCMEMLKIPYGAQWTYGDIARNLGKPAQAVGGGCGRNPIPIIIPCHRVVAANGSMTGFSGGEGVETKVWLLQHEGVIFM